MKPVESMHDEGPTPEARQPTAHDRISSLLQRPGPYTSVYLATLPLLGGETADRERHLAQRWNTVRAELERQGAPTAVIAAIDARRTLPAPSDAAGLAIIAAADGTTVVDHGLEPPHHDVGVVDTLPYVAPLFEWEQRRVSHVVVNLDDRADAHIVGFGPGPWSTAIETTARIDHAVDDAATTALAIGARLVVVSGPRGIAEDLRSGLTGRLSADCRVVVDHDARTPDELAESTVRLVSDATARATVGHLKELRFLATHGGAAEGVPDTLAALRERRVRLLLIHDDPSDERRVSTVGPLELSTDLRPPAADHARLVDACICAAVRADADVYIIPSTGPQGPADNIGALTTDPPRPEPIPTA